MCALAVRRRPLPSFFVDRLASGAAEIAAAFYPRPVIVRRPAGERFDIERFGPDNARP